jgi:hypothetical protein
MIQYGHIQKIIHNTLLEIPNGYSFSSQLAIEMIIAHESQRGKWLWQLGGGPAHGLIMMEPPTHEATWQWGDSIKENAEILGITEDFDRLDYDIRYNVFMARQRLFMKSEALPSDAVGMSEYLKKHWNTIHGKATAEKYFVDWQTWKHLT